MRDEIPAAKTALTVTEQLKAMPAKPGVYQYRDTYGTLLYVGKAKNLKNRVSSYFHTQANHTPRIAAMVARVAKIDYIVTHSDIEALLLEANLVKTHRPKYNVALKDDKKYPWLVLTHEPFPRLEYRREPGKRKGEKSFGPYASPGALYQTLQLIKKIFPLRQRRKPLFKDRPCMNYFIGSCLGPCQNLVTAQEYEHIVRQMTLFLKGHADDLLGMVKTEMDAASEAMDFEKAALLRDRYQAVQTVMQRQRVMVSDITVDQDVVGMVESHGTAYFAVLKIRRGKLIQTLFFDVLTNGEPLEAAYRAFLFQFYEENASPDALPTELILQMDIEDRDFLAEWLSSTRGRNVQITLPQRGPKKELLDMALKNAEEVQTRAGVDRETRHQNDPAQAVLLLQEQLGLREVPQRIECYDISHVSGTNTVASMVVFTDGLPDKKEYRRFKIQSTEEGTPDDFKSMREVMTRRFSKREEKNWPDPDLIIIDGGKGQLSSAVEALQDLGITEQPIVSLAKKFEEIYFPNQSRPVIIPRDSLALFLVQRIRDEAHRFAITYHRTLRGKSQVQSALDAIPGIGVVRKQKLLSHFPSLQAMQNASLQEIATASGTSGKTAQSLFDALQKSLAVAK